MTTTGASPEPPTGVRGGVIATVGIIVRALGVRVFVRPYREGRLRDIDWPRGLKPIVVVAVAGYAIAVLGVVLSPLARAKLTLRPFSTGDSLAFPREVLWPLLLLVLVTVALLHAATLHVRWWLMALSSTLTTLVILTSGATAGALRLDVTRIVGFAAVLGLIAFTVYRRRRTFVWWEFPVVLVVIGLPIAVANQQAIARNALFGFDFGPEFLSLLLTSIGLLALPAALAAGAAVAELSLSAAVWTTELVRTTLPRVVLTVGLCLIVGWRLWASAAQVVGSGDVGRAAMDLVGSAALVAVVGGIWYLLNRTAGRAGSTQLSVSDLSGQLSVIATPVALALTCAVGPVVVMSMVRLILLTYQGPSALSGWLGGSVDAVSRSQTVYSVRTAIGVLLIAVAFWLARRGRRGTPELLGAVGVVVLSLYAPLVVDTDSRPLWTADGVTTVATLVSVVLLVGYLARHRLTATRTAGLTVALLLAALFSQHDFVSDPLAAVLGFTGVAFVLFGFVWNLLTGAGKANQDSPGFPRPSRVLLVLASSLFGVTVLAFNALSRDDNATINLGAMAGLGDNTLGAGLLIGSFIAVISAVSRSRELN